MMYDGWWIAVDGWLLMRIIMNDVGVYVDDVDDGDADDNGGADDVHNAYGGDKYFDDDLDDVAL